MSDDENREDQNANTGKLFIGGLSWETTDESLRSYFSKYGDISDSVVMREPNTGRSRGFGFVTFTDPTAADKVLQDKHTLDGKTIDPKHAVPHDHAPPPRMEVVVELKTRKIFVGGVAPSTTEAAFRSYFSQFGKVEDAVLMIDKETGRPRGFGFITFDTEESAERACEKKIHEIDGKPGVEVKKAEPKGFRREIPVVPPSRQRFSRELIIDRGYDRPGYPAYASGRSMAAYPPIERLYIGGMDRRAPLDRYDGYAASAGGYGYSSGRAGPATGPSPSASYNGRSGSRGGSASSRSGYVAPSGFQDPYYGSAGVADLAADYGRTPSSLYSRAAEYANEYRSAGPGDTYNEYVSVHYATPQRSQRYQPYGRS